MRVDLIKQSPLGHSPRRCVGDVLRSSIDANWCKTFKFAVAYMRTSGLNRLKEPIERLLQRGGSVSGAVGIGDVTSYESLAELSSMSRGSTVFYTGSFLFHPKTYLMSGDDRAVAVIGSANLTRDGLYRNIESAVEIGLDLTCNEERRCFLEYESVVDDFMDTTHPNVKSITGDLLEQLLMDGMVTTESRLETDEPESGIRASSLATSRTVTMFPPIAIPRPPPPATHGTTAAPVRLPGRASASMQNTVLVIQLSSFDCSHRTDVPGTPEVLIPLDAENFFPPLAQGASYMESHFDVSIRNPAMSRSINARLWYYDSKHELRLRLSSEVIDLTTVGGDDLMMLSKTTTNQGLRIEMSVIPPTDSRYQQMLAMCNRSSQGKRWGMN